MKVVQAIAAILAAIGFVALCVAIVSYREQAAFIEEAGSAQGEVAQLIQRTKSGRKGTTTYYSYRVKFTTPRGERIEGEAMETSASPRFAQGEKVAVVFSRAEPPRFNFDDFAMLWGDVVVLFVFAGTFLGAGLSAFWIAGGRPSTRRVRTEATLPEVARAWREGRLTRDSEYQGLLIAFAFAGFPILGGTIVFVLFAPGVVQFIVGAMLAWVAFHAIRARRAAKAAERP